LSANHSAEEVVLGTLLADPKAVHFFDMLTTDDFDLPTHQMIFIAGAALAKEGRAPSPVVLAPQFCRDRMGSGTIADYLGYLAAKRFVSREHLSDYIRALKEMAGRRIMTTMAGQMSEIAGSPTAPIGPFLDDAVETLGEIRSTMRRQRVSSLSAGELAQTIIDRLRSGEAPRLVDTGLTTLNRHLGGWPRGELTILAGRPSMGKSSIALTCMRQAARRGVSSLLISLEMPGPDVTARMLSDAVFNKQTPIEYASIMRNKVSDWDVDRLAEVQKKLADLPIEIDDQRGIGMADISVRARRYHDRLLETGKRLDTLWVDHLGHIRPTGRYAGQKVQELGEITKGCMVLASELDCAVVLLCQLSRALESRDDKRPQLSDLRESGHIEEDANTVLFAYRESYYLERLGEFADHEKELARRDRIRELMNVLEILGLKTRNGPVFSAKFFADMGSNVVRDLAA
jgi:replicative DNA helicase